MPEETSIVPFNREPGDLAKTTPITLDTLTWEDDKAIPIFKFYDGVELIFDGKRFHDYDNLWEALEKCRNRGYRPLFMPEVIDSMIGFLDSIKKYRVEEKGSDYGDFRFPDSYGGGTYLTHAQILNRYDTTTQSMRILGKTKVGNNVAIYIHIPSYSSNPMYLRRSERFGGGILLPRSEFDRLLDLEDDKNVFVTDYKYPQSIFDPSLKFDKSILRNRLVTSFLGGKRRTEELIEKCKEVLQRRKRDIKLEDPGSYVNGHGWLHSCEEESISGYVIANMLRIKSLSDFVPNLEQIGFSLEHVDMFSKGANLIGIPDSSYAKPKGIYESHQTRELLEVCIKCV